MMLLADRSGLVQSDWELLWRALFDESFDTAWMDPIMRERAEIWRHFEQGDLHFEQMLPIARRWSRSAMGSAERQAQLSAALWFEVGVGEGHVGGLSRHLEVRERLLGAPREALDAVIARHSGNCADPAADACLVYALAAWRVDQQVLPEDWAELEPANELELEAGPLAQLLNIAYDGDVLAVAAATRYLEGIGEWSREGLNTQNERLHALLLRERQQGIVVDPTAVFSDYATSPWCMALALDLIVGDGVSIFKEDTTDLVGPYVQLGDYWIHATPDGLRSASPPSVNEPMLRAELFALSVLEMALDRARRRDLPVALLLTGLAERSSAVAAGASNALARRCGVAEGDKSATIGASIGAWSHGTRWPSAAQDDDAKPSLGAQMIVAGLEDGC
jgi:hypothetical protein